ncbi:MAG: pyridoxal phosphate-dependent aminotransferase [Desulfovibrionaceae bacterium]|nr:pyridoxal phosphate-dependent aminotransferase [Desulfovibrionaceae bacterium]
MKLSSRMSLIKPAATLAINSKALELKSQGIPVISLAVGEPDFDTPLYAREAAKKAIDAGFTHYTQVGGIPALRNAVANYIKRVHNIDGVTADNIIVSNGGKQGLYSLMQTLLDPGDEVLIPAPYWTSYPEMVVMNEGVPVPVPATFESGYKVTPADLEAHLTEKTRMLVINSPCNPTGACYNREEMDAILDWAVGHGLFIISDEMYEQLVYEPATLVSAAAWFLRYPEQIAIANGLSKAYAMTGWRVGFTVAAPQIIKAMTMVQSQMTSNICSIAQYASVAALEGPQDSISVMRNEFLRRRDMAYAEISTWQGVRCLKPDGAFYLFLDVSALLDEECPDDVAMCNKLLERGHVAAVPGAAFGAPGCLRLSYAVKDEVLTEALKRMRSILVK